MMLPVQNQLSVSFIPPVSAHFPLQGRKYTATYSAITGDIFAAVGNRFAIGTMNTSKQDFLKAEWKTILGEFMLLGTIDLSCSEEERTLAQVRSLIFKKELPKLLSAIFHGDRDFLHYYPLLLDAPIRIEFRSNIKELQQCLDFGTPRQYLA
ncbi:staygreen family protein [Heyndrickxia acidiproducens]|uniref:staygreen family protein n=1 Tax=Heyndrickxia acidiproducens TaxID=1121084 RepID=UPI000370B1D9|nr:staygreen family protein [Heyndrickxia acidiproducens]